MPETIGLSDEALALLRHLLDTKDSQGHRRESPSLPRAGQARHHVPDLWHGRRT